MLGIDIKQSLMCNLFAENELIPDRNRPLDREPMLLGEEGGFPFGYLFLCYVCVCGVLRIVLILCGLSNCLSSCCPFPAI